jgi:excisionase family DNA binding protein
MTPEQAAGYLGVSETMLREWRLRGEGPPHVPLSERKIRYRAEDLDAWVASRVVGKVRTGVAS